MALPPKLYKAADRLNTWIGLFTVVAGGFSWLGTQLEGLKPYGWPEAILFGVILTALLTLVAAAFMVAYRKFRPLSVGTSKADPDDGAGIDFTPLERVEGLEALRDTVGAVAASLREQEDLPGQVKALSIAVEKTNGDIQKATEILKRADHAILQLVDFATLQATAVLLNDLIRSAPKTKPDSELSDINRGHDLDFIQRVRSQFAGTHRGVMIENILQMSEHESEQIIEGTPIGERNPADPIRYRRWAIASRQVEKLAFFLVSQRREIEESITGYRTALIDQYRSRSPS